MSYIRVLTVHALFNNAVGTFSNFQEQPTQCEPKRKVIQLRFATILSLELHVFELYMALQLNTPVTGDFPAQRTVTWIFDAFFDLRLHKRLSKQSWRWWFEMPSCPLWRHSNVYICNLDFFCIHTRCSVDNCRTIISLQFPGQMLVIYFSMVEPVAVV